MVTKHVGFRCALEDLTLIQRVCRDRGENVADFARRSIRKELAIMGYLSKEEVKALGVRFNDKQD